MTTTTEHDEGLITESATEGVAMDEAPPLNGPEGATTYYPPTPIGSLMRDLDSARGSARLARERAAELEANATDADARADALERAIAALTEGGSS